MTHDDAARLDRLNQLVIDAEYKVTEQALLVESMEYDGLDTAAARKLLRTFETILAEAIIARRTIMDQCRAAKGSLVSPQIRE